MNLWSSKDARAMTSAHEIQVITRREDGSLRGPRTIWVVGDGDRVFVRSTNGRTADWFRHATATGAGQVHAAGKIYEIIFSEANDADLARVDAAYRAKYGQYASIVDHLEEAGPRGATLELKPAGSQATVDGRE